jgi:geranylgeranyl diphosphate synthase type II
VVTDFDLQAYLKARAAQVEAALATTLPPGPDRLLEAMRYSLLGGGKRLRPVLAMAAAEWVGADPTDVMPFACALEYIHTYSLIHDDLPCMDDDDYRRGRLTNHKVYGEAIATLAGDALLTHAFALVVQQAQRPGANPVAVLETLQELAVAAGAAGMVGGQVEDLLWEGRNADLAQLQHIHALKTGALFRAALVGGGRLAGATPQQLAALRTYAEHFGLAFQITDDILDVVGDSAKLGKSTGSDERKQKSTYVRHLGLAGARERAAAEVAAAVAALGDGERGAALRSLAHYIIMREQ